MQHTEQPECERVAFWTVEKPFLACFSGPKPSVLLHFSLESEPTGKTPFFLSEVHLFSIRCEGTKISGIFTNWCQLNKSDAVTKILQPKEKYFGKSAGLFGGAISFLPLFWLYFNWRIYEYGDKGADFMEKCRFRASILMEKCLKKSDSLEKSEMNSIYSLEKM